jgi:hypothetical protein
MSVNTQSKRQRLHSNRHSAGVAPSAHSALTTVLPQASPGLRFVSPTIQPGPTQSTLRLADGPRSQESAVDVSSYRLCPPRCERPCVGTNTVWRPPPVPVTGTLSPHRVGRVSPRPWRDSPSGDTNPRHPPAARLVPSVVNPPHPIMPIAQATHCLSPGLLSGPINHLGIVLKAG